MNKWINPYSLCFERRVGAQRATFGFHQWSGPQREAGSAAGSCLRARINQQSISLPRVVWVWVLLCLCSNTLSIVCVCAGEQIFRRLIFMRPLCKFGPFTSECHRGQCIGFDATLCCSDKYWWNAPWLRAAPTLFCVRALEKTRGIFMGWNLFVLSPPPPLMVLCYTAALHCGVSSINIYRRPPRKAQSTLWLIKRRMRKRAERWEKAAPSSKIFKAKQISSRAYSITRAKTSVCK